MTEQLSRQLNDLAASQNPDVDWAGRVRATIRRRGRVRAVAGATVAAVAVGAAVTGLLVVPRNRDELSVLAQTPVGPNASPTAAASSPAPPPSAASSPSAATTASVAPSRHETQPSSSPQPAYGQDPRQVITLAVTGDTTVTAGDTVRYDATAASEFGQPYIHAARYDGVQEGQEAVFSCPQARPGPKAPGRATRAFDHVFTDAGVHTVEIRADAACSYYQGRAVKTFKVTVRPAPSSSPSPSTTP